MEESYYISGPSVDTESVILKCYCLTQCWWSTDSFPPALHFKEWNTPHNPGKHEIPKRWPHEAADRGVCCEINSERVCVSKAYIFFILFSSKQPQGGRLKRDRDQLLMSFLISLTLWFFSLSIYSMTFLFQKA